MIISFSVANFRSFAGEETLNLIASKAHPDRLDQHSAPIPFSEERVLRTGVLYGANGAGKSNLFLALDYMKRMALRPRGKDAGTGRDAFKFGHEKDNPTVFDLQFLEKDNVYRYGFTVDDDQVNEEWLVKVKGNNEKEIFERKTTEQGEVIIEIKRKTGVSNKLKALATVGGPKNQTFLSTIRANLQPKDCNEDLTAVISWLSGKLSLIKPDEPIAPIGALLTSSSDFLEFAGEFLKTSSTGVDHLKATTRELTEEEAKTMLPPGFDFTIFEQFDHPNAIAISISDGMELKIIKDKGLHFHLVSIKSAHEHTPGDVIQLDLSEESDGTRRLLELIPALHKLKQENGVFIIDEIDRSMHPMLVMKILEFFLRSCGGGHRQIIITTHESNLLNLDLLRRDEIWFAEKDHQGATRLYSLADFKVRKDLQIQKHYLQGRFGAIPFLGGLDRLIETEKCIE